jgi:MscS family membrane protein
VRSRALFFGAFLCTAAAVPQIAPRASPATGQLQQEPAAPGDVLGRSTPRGAVLGFLKAVRKEDYPAAVEYLNTRLTGNAAEKLAHQLYVMLNRRLPARLNELSNKPEGSLTFLSKPDEDLVGTISSSRGNVDIVVQKVRRGDNPQVWLFSQATLDAIPGLYSEIDTVSPEQVLPRFFVQTRIGGVPVFQWIAIFSVPVLYWIISVIRRALVPCIASLFRLVAKTRNVPDIVLLPHPVRMLILVALIYWGASKVRLSLLARQIWLAGAVVITIVAVVWLLMLLNGEVERLTRRRLERVNGTGSISMLRLCRRSVDLLVIFCGILFGLHYFGVNSTTALTGLGIGGVAIALAAQKTLENIIGGMSVMFDHVIRVGDLVKTGDTLGFVEFIGLRSTRIRTFNRTVVAVPNGQLAAVTIENYSGRDRFWLIHYLSLLGNTRGPVLCAIVDEINGVLLELPGIDPASVRVRLLRLGANSDDIEIFGYVRAPSFERFLELQQEALLRILSVVDSAGAERAISVANVYVNDGVRGTKRPVVPNIRMSEDGAK